MDIQEALVEQRQLEDKGDDESTARNFKVVARKADLLARASAKSGREGRK